MTATALPSEGLTRELIAAFEMHCGHAQKNGQPPLLHLPFGADSHRWSLTREARVLFRQLKRVSAR